MEERSHSPSHAHLPTRPGGAGAGGWKAALAGTHPRPEGRLCSGHSPGSLPEDRPEPRCPPGTQPFGPSCGVPPSRTHPGGTLASESALRDVREERTPARGRGRPHHPLSLAHCLPPPSHTRTATPLGRWEGHLNTSCPPTPPQVHLSTAIDRQHSTDPVPTGLPGGAARSP